MGLFLAQAFHLAPHILGGRQLVRHWFETQPATGLAPAADGGAPSDGKGRISCVRF